MNPVHLLLIRHAQTFDNGNLTPEPGKSPWDLSPHGYSQCRHLGTAVAQRVDRSGSDVSIHSSTAARAVATAAAVRLATKAGPVTPTADLLELGYGDLGVPVKDGREWCRVIAEKKQQWQEQGGHLDDFKLKGGMSHREMMAHALRVVGELLGRSSASSIVVVAHAMFNVMLLRGLLGLSDGVAQDNACINELRVCRNSLLVADGWTLNNTSHLPSDLCNGSAPPTLDHEES